MKEKSAVRILKELRKSHGEKYKFYFLSYYVFMAILIVDLVFVFMVRGEMVQFWGKMGFLAITMLIAFSFLNMHNEDKEIEHIDNFYLEHTMKGLQK